MAVYFTENRISWVYVQSLDRLERISLPIGKGAILQDRRGCLWSVMEGEKAPRLVALTDEVNKPLCRP